MQIKHSSSIAHWVISLIIVITLHASLVVALMIDGHTTPIQLTIQNAIAIELAPLVKAPNEVSQKDISQSVDEQIAEPTIEPPQLPIESAEPKVVINKQPKPKLIKQTTEPNRVSPRKITHDPLPKAETSTATDVTDNNLSNQFATSQTQVSTQSSKAQIIWQSRLFKYITKYKRYPETARDQKQQGTVSVEFTIDTGGKVYAPRIIKSSGYPLLDQEVLNLLERAQPLPYPPTEILNGKNSRTVAIPINFNLKDRN